MGGLSIRKSFLTFLGRNILIVVGVWGILRVDKIGLVETVSLIIGFGFARGGGGVSITGSDSICGSLKSMSSTE